MKPKKNFLPLAIFTLLTSGIFAQDWPQFLGPDRNSKSPETEILRTWSEGGPEVLWTVPVGIGYGGPVVKNGKVYLLDGASGTVLATSAPASGRSGLAAADRYRIGRDGVLLRLQRGAYRLEIGEGSLFYLKYIAC